MTRQNNLSIHTPYQAPARPHAKGVIHFYFVCNNQFLVQKLNSDDGSPQKNLWPKSN